MALCQREVGCTIAGFPTEERRVDYPIRPITPDEAETFFKSNAIGFGHDAKTWKDIASAFRMVGYDYVVSIEHEDGMMSNDEGLGKGIAALKEALIFEPAGEMFWA